MTAPTYTYPEAAAKLGKRETWLRRHINTLPHYRIGQTVSFSDAHLDAIRAASEVVPAKFKPVDVSKPSGRRRAS